MIKVCYTEADGPSGPTCRLEASGHARYGPAGQDIVCAGASVLMETLVCMLAGEKDVKSDGWDEPGGPRLAVTAAAPQRPRVEAAFDFAKAGFALLAERYPDHLRFADVSRRGKQAMMDLQLFAEGDGAAPAAESAPAPALSRAQTRQAVASGTMRAPAGAPPTAPPTPQAPENRPPKPPEPPESRTPPKRLPPLPPRGRQAVRALHARWAAEEAALRRVRPDFSLRAELKNPEMRRLMRLPGMRMGDAYRLAHYGDAMRQTARAVERGVVERIRQRAARPAENGTRPGFAAVTGTDVAHMTLAQREALEKQALHGATIKL